MRQIHDIDVLLLLATAVAAKRRPADLTEIIAALDFLQTTVNEDLKLPVAMQRLSTLGLISETDGRFALSSDAQGIVSNPRLKADTNARIFGIKEALNAYQPSGDHPEVLVSEADFEAALAAHREAGKTGGKNLLMPKPKPPEVSPRGPGYHLRKPLPAAKRGKPQFGAKRAKPTGSHGPKPAGARRKPGPR